MTYCRPGSARQAPALPWRACQAHALALRGWQGLVCSVIEAALPSWALVMHGMDEYLHDTGVRNENVFIGDAVMSTLRVNQ